MQYTISLPRIFFVLLAIGIVAALVLSVVLPNRAQADILFRELDRGMSGADVSTLQTFLATDITIYPQGLVTGFFGPLTFSAVSNFQSRNGIATVGRVGPITLAAINRLSGSIGGSSDVNAPAITVVTLGSSTSSISVAWTTNEETMSTLYYSASPISLTESQTGNPYSVSVTGIAVQSANAGLSRSHNVNVQNLQANTTYYYAVRAADQAGNVSVTWPSSVLTKNR